VFAPQTDNDFQSFDNYFVGRMIIRPIFSDYKYQ